LLIIALKLIVIYTMERALLGATILLTVGSTSALKHPDCQWANA